MLPPPPPDLVSPRQATDGNETNERTSEGNRRKRQSKRKQGLGWSPPLTGEHPAAQETKHPGAQLSAEREPVGARGLGWRPTQRDLRDPTGDGGHFNSAPSEARKGLGPARLAPGRPFCPHPHHGDQGPPSGREGTAGGKGTLVQDRGGGHGDPPMQLLTGTRDLWSRRPQAQAEPLTVHSRREERRWAREAGGQEPSLWSSTATREEGPSEDRVPVCACVHLSAHVHVRAPACACVCSTCVHVGVRVRGRWVKG